MADPLDAVRTYLKAHTIRELAEASGVPRATIANWLGERGLPSAVRQWHQVLAEVKRKRPRR